MDAAKSMDRLSEDGERLLGDLKAAIEACPEQARSFVIPLNLNSLHVPVKHAGLRARSQLVPRGVVDELLQAGFLRRSHPESPRRWGYEITSAGYAYRSTRSVAGKLIWARRRAGPIAALVTAIVLLIAALATIVSFLTPEA